MDKRKIFLTDTTLRDGEQSPDISFDEATKLIIARLLDRTGFYSIEAGIPAMGSETKDTICKIMDIRKNAKIAVWNRMNTEDIRHSFDCIPDVIHISAPVSDQLLFTMLNKDRSWLAKNLKACVAFAKEKDYEVTVGLQDASRADVTFMIELANMLKEMGVYTLRLADTVGILVPTTMRRLIGEFKRNSDIQLSIHTHNDFGMANALAAEAAKEGATFIDTTLFGIGERAGNCDCFEFVENTNEQFEIRPAVSMLDSIKQTLFYTIFPDSNHSNWDLKKEKEK